MKVGTIAKLRENAYLLELGKDIENPATLWTMNIFVTGGSGFVGGAVLKQLASGHKLKAMARSDASANRVKALGATPVRCNLGNVQANHIEGCDVLVHAAAFVEPWGSRSDFWEANVEGTIQLLQAAREAGVKRFIFIGTEAALFKGQDMVDIDESYPYPEHTPFLYSETKAEAERRVLAANQAGFETLSLRPRLVWGPGDTTVLPNLIEMVDKGAFKWVGGGKARTSTCHINNLASAVNLALDKGNGGEAYFITDGETTTFRSFLTALLATADRTPSSQNVPAWAARMIALVIETTWKLFGIRKKPPITRFSAAIVTADCILKIEKARDELGYAPVVSIAEGLEQLTKDRNFAS